MRSIGVATGDPCFNVRIGKMAVRKYLVADARTGEIVFCAPFGCYTIEGLCRWFGRELYRMMTGES